MKENKDKHNEMREIIIKAFNPTEHKLELMLEYANKHAEFEIEVGKSAHTSPGTTTFLPLALSIFDKLDLQGKTVEFINNATPVHVPFRFDTHDIWCAEAEDIITHEIIKNVSNKINEQLKVSTGIKIGKLTSISPNATSGWCQCCWQLSAR